MGFRFIIQYDIPQMHGTFNSVRLSKITSLKFTDEASGVRLKSFRVMEAPLPELEKVPNIGASALLIVSSGETEGLIVEFSGNVQLGHEITIESMAVKD